MWHLSLGLKSIKKKDSSPVRKQLFDDFLKSHKIIADLLSIFPEKLIAIIAPAYAFYRLLYVDAKLYPNDRFIAVYQYENESRCIYSRVLSKPNSCITVKSPNFKNLGLILFFLKPAQWPYIFRLWLVGSKLVSKNGLLVGLRQSQYLVFYSYFIYLLYKKRRSTFKYSPVFLISSESNPETIGPVLAAMRLGYKSVYFPHGFLDLELGVFFHNIILCQGRSHYERIKPNTLNFLNATDCTQSFQFVGHYFKKTNLKTGFTEARKIGIVCSLSPDINLLRKLILEIKANLPSAVIELRTHPNNLFSVDLKKLFLEFTDLKSKLPVDWHNDPPNWDIAFAGNTSAHLDLLGLGILSIGYPLDYYLHDRYGFYSTGLVPYASDLANIVEKAKSFYLNPAWIDIVENYLPTLDSALDLNTLMETHGNS